MPLWGALIGAGRAYLNVNETIASLMLNFVAVDFLQYLINGPWEAPGSGNWPTSNPYPPNAMPPVFTLAKVQINSSVMLALIAVAGLVFWFTYTRGGLIARFLLHNPRLARFAQIPAQRWTLIVMALAGVFPALAGIYQSTLVEGRLQAGFYEGYMMGGFVAAWIARNDFIALDCNLTAARRAFFRRRRAPARRQSARLHRYRDRGSDHSRGSAPPNAQARHRLKLSA